MHICKCTNTYHCVYMNKFAYIYIHTYTHTEASQQLSGKESTFGSGAAGDAGLIPGLGRSPGGGHGNPLQYTCLENPMHRGAWWAMVHKVTKSWT